MASGQQSQAAFRYRPRHDACYKQLFDHAVVVKDLISGFIAPHLSDKFNFSTLEKVPSSYVSNSLKQRHIDRVWRVRLRGSGRWLYILLEFQSTVDLLMGVRMLTYIGLLYEDICRNKANLGPQGELPEIWPIVLFNGDTPWTAPLTVNAVALARGDGHRDQVFPEYFVFCPQEYPLDDLPPDNVVSLLIRLERIPRSGAPMDQLLGDIRAWLRKFDKDDYTRQSLIRAISNWVGEYLMLKDKIDSSLDPWDQLERMQNLAMNWEAPEWAQGWLEEGLAKGRTEGIEKGRTEGRTEGIEEGIEKGRTEGIEKGRTEVLGAIRKSLYLQAGSRFDPETVGRLTQHLDQVSDPERLLEISGKIHEGATCAALLKCLKNRS